MMRLALVLLFISVVSASAITKDELIRQIRTLNKQQTEELDRLRVSHKTAIEDVDKAKKQVLEVAVERDGWRDYGNDQHEKFINAEKRVAEETVKKQRWVMMFSGLAVVVALYFGLKFFTPLGKFIP